MPRMNDSSLFEEKHNDIFVGWGDVVKEKKWKFV
jgi:hypothetical protein